MFTRVIYWQNGHITVMPAGINQPVNGAGRYQVPLGFGNMARRVDIHSPEGSITSDWSVNWYEPWKGNPLGGL